MHENGISRHETAKLGRSKGVRKFGTKRPRVRIPPLRQKYESSTDGSFSYERGRGAVPRWVVTCNFEEFRIYDLDHPQAGAQVIKLAELPDECYRLKFLVDTGNDILKQGKFFYEQGKLDRKQGKLDTRGVSFA